MTPMLKVNNQWVRIFKIFIPYIFSVGIFQIIAASIIGIDYRNYNVENLSTFQFFILNFSGLIGTVFIIGVFLKFIDKEIFKDLGFHYLLLKDIKLGLLIGLSIMAISFMILLLSSQIMILSIKFNSIDVSLSILSFTCVALSEEILIRGYVLGNLMKCINKYYALFWSSVIFSLMHAANPNITWFSFFELFVSGIFLGISYLSTKNLWFPISLHFSWNFFQGTLFGFNVSGVNVYSIVQHKRFTDNILNGGIFGYEGSILSIIFQITFIVIILRVFKTQNLDHSVI
jgi:membrane protease YdiL (CAAX protease family)